MRVGVFDPYLDILGGGERYILTLASHLSERGHRVDVFWNNDRLKRRLTERLGIKLGKINFVEDIFSSNKNLYQKWQITRKYDLIFFLSDGSLPFLFGKRNFLLFLVPFTNVNGRSSLNKVKLKKIHKIISISKFTKKYIDQEYGVKSRVIYPPAMVEAFKPRKKEDLVISVGRFFKPVKHQKGLIRPLHSKKQEIMIEVFKKMCDQGLKNWRLALIGGATKEDENYIKFLKKSADGYPIELKTNIKFTELKKDYGKAKIYWHAAGFGEDEQKHPEKMEHFGITTVEAMAAGCVPIVINKGGLPEIITDKVNGLLWVTRSDLVKATLSAIGGQAIKSQALWQKLSPQAIKDSRRFSKQVFCQKIDELVKG